jgi:hypothetical protein
MSDRPTLSGDRRIAWQNVLTVVSAAILIGAEVFGAAFAGGWAVENLTGFGSFVVRMAHSVVAIFGVDFTASAHAGVFVLQAFFFILGVMVMAAFMRTAQRVEPFFVKG